ncbi:MAG: alanine/glycine:cation symporter family protein [Robiginitomaculum sp.]
MQNFMMLAASTATPKFPAWEAFKAAITSFSNMLWNGPLTLLLLGTGLFLTVITMGICLRRIPSSFKMMFSKHEHNNDGDITPFQALSTALAATVGTGNIVGVATAIGIGGPGAVFWMWVVAILGITTKYSESLLAVEFRIKDKAGAMAGGPMYYIEKGMGKKWKWLAIMFACGALFAAFVTGNMIQANAVASAVNNATLDMFGGKGMPTSITGAVLALATFTVIIGGITGIGRVAAKLIPTMAVIYILLALFIIIANYKAVPGAFHDIFSYAFNGKAATGGFVGAMVIAAIRAGVARGLFSNEAGQGSAPMAHAAATIKDPVTQARIAMLGTVIDTLIICTMTALVILTLPGLDFTTISALGDGSYEQFSNSAQPLSVAIYQGTPMSKDDVTQLTSIAFAQALPGGSWMIAIAMIVFSFTTILGWSYYGERALGYLTGTTNFMIYRVLWCFAAFVGALMQIDFIWRLGDVATAAMTAPNLIALLALSGVVVKLTKDYDKNAKALPKKER